MNAPLSPGVSAAIAIALISLAATAAGAGQGAAGAADPGPGTLEFAGIEDNADFRQHRLAISIDGVWRGHFNLYAASSEQRVISFNNLGPGPHIMQVRHYNGPVRVDAFETPGFAPFYTSTVPAGWNGTTPIHCRHSGNTLRQTGNRMVHTGLTGVQNRKLPGKKITGYG